jgi:hypothetical protein
MRLSQRSDGIGQTKNSARTRRIRPRSSCRQLASRRQCGIAPWRCYEVLMTKVRSSTQGSHLRAELAQMSQSQLRLVDALQGGRVDRGDVGMMSRIGQTGNLEEEGSLALEECGPGILSQAICRASWIIGRVPCEEDVHVRCLGRRRYFGALCVFASENPQRKRSSFTYRQSDVFAQGQRFLNCSPIWRAEVRRSRPRAFDESTQGREGSL